MLNLIQETILTLSLFCSNVVGLTLMLFILWILLRHVQKDKEYQLEAAEVYSTIGIAEKQAEYVRLTPDGIAAPIDDVVNGTYTPELLNLQYHNQEMQRTYPNVPRTISTENNAFSPDGLDDASEFQMPTFYELWNSRQLPMSDFLLGYSQPQFQSLIKSWSDVGNCMIGGVSGSGKSTFTRLVTCQAALQGARYMVIDPHYLAGEESLGQSLQPLHGLLAAEIAYDNESINGLCDYILSVADNRLNGVDMDRTPLILIADEFNAIMANSATNTAMREVVRKLCTETRKVNIYLWSLGQSFNGKYLGPEVRDLFQSAIVLPSSRNIMGDYVHTEGKREIETLTVGEGVWQKLGAQSIRFSFPKCDASDIKLVADSIGSQVVPDRFPLLESNRSQPEREPLGNHAGTTWELPGSHAYLEETILNLHIAGKSKTAIYNQVFKDKGILRKSDALKFIEEVLTDDATVS